MERWAALLRNFLTAFVTWQAVTASGPGLAADRKTVDPFDCRPAAIAPSDNDIWLVRTPHLSGLPVEIPPAVSDAIHNSAARLMEETKQDGDRIEVKDCAEMFVGTYRIAVPHNRDLFVADIKMGWSNQFFYLFLYDPSTGAVTQRPRRVQSYWFEGLLERESKTLVQQPVISFVDLYQNGERQILIQERIHSGNMFNFVVCYYVYIGPNLELTNVLGYETRSYGIWAPDDVPDDSAEFADHDGLLLDELEQLTPTRLRLITFFEPWERGPRRRIGYAILESPGPGQPFRVIERHLEDPNYRRAFGESEDRR